MSVVLCRRPRPHPEQSFCARGLCGVRFFPPCHPLGPRTHILSLAMPLDAISRWIWPGGPAVSPRARAALPSPPCPPPSSRHPAYWGSAAAEPASTLPHTGVFAGAAGLRGPSWVGGCQPRCPAAAGHDARSRREEPRAGSQEREQGAQEGNAQPARWIRGDSHR